MKLASVQRVVGALVAWSSLMMLPPALVSWLYDDGVTSLFGLSAAVLVLLGGLIYLPVRRASRDLRLRDGFLIVVACWLALALVAVAGLVASDLWAQGPISSPPPRLPDLDPRGRSGEPRLAAPVALRRRAAGRTDE